MKLSTIKYCWFIFLMPLIIQAQVGVKNVTFEVNERTKTIDISYDLIGKSNADSVYLEIETRTNGIFIPKKLKGDIGKSVQSGPNKRIIWDFVSDDFKVDEEIRVIVGVWSGLSKTSQIAQNKETSKNLTQNKKIPIEKSKVKIPKEKGPLNKKMLMTLGAGVVVGAGLSISSFSMKSIAEKYYNDYKNNNWNQNLVVNTDEFLRTYSQGSIDRANADLAKAQKQLKTSNMFLYGGIALVALDAVYTLPRLRRKTNKKISFQPIFLPNQTFALSLNLKI